MKLSKKVKAGIEKNYLILYLKRPSTEKQVQITYKTVHLQYKHRLSAGTSTTAVITQLLARNGRKLPG